MCYLIKIIFKTAKVLLKLHRRAYILTFNTLRLNIIYKNGSETICVSLPSLFFMKTFRISSQILLSDYNLEGLVSHSDCVDAWKCRYHSVAVA